MPQRCSTFVSTLKKILVPSSPLPIRCRAAQAVIPCAMLFHMGFMKQVRVDLLRLDRVSDVLGLLDEILGFYETSRDENVAPLHPTRPMCSRLPGQHTAVRASGLPVPRIALPPLLTEYTSVVETTGIAGSIPCR